MSYPLGMVIGIRFQKVGATWLNALVAIFLQKGGRVGWGLVEMYDTGIFKIDTGINREPV